MKEFLVMTILLIVICGLGYIKSDSIKMEWMDKKFTTIIKGFSILTVIWAHGGAELHINGIQFIAGVGVALFLICSGYGLELSYKKNGLKFFWIKRLSKILIPLFIMEAIWETIIDRSFSIAKYIDTSFSLYQGGWFIKYIIICYCIFFVCKLITINLLNLSDKNEIKFLFLCFVLFFIFECINPYMTDIPFLRARQMFSFFFGVILAKNKNILFSTHYKNKSLAISSILLSISILFMAITQIPTIKFGKTFIVNILSLFTVFPIAIAFIILSQYFTKIFQNKILKFIGLISFELFLSQGYFLNYINPTIPSIFLYIIKTFLLALIVYIVSNILSFAFHRLDIKHQIIVSNILFVLFILFTILLFTKNQYRQAKNTTRTEECNIIPGILCIGDSLTCGTDGSYPMYLEENMIKDGYYIPVFNAGIGGENTVTIAGRLGGIQYKVADFDMPSDDTPVTISFIDDENHKITPFRQKGNDMINPVIINGVAGEITISDDYSEYYFTKIVDDNKLSELTISQKESIKSGNYALNTVETKGQTLHNDCIYIVFMGENGGFDDIDELISQQKAILSQQTINDDKYLIIGLTTGNNDSRKELEEAMEKEYGNRYINLRKYFTNNIPEFDLITEASKYNISFSENDIAMMSNGQVPDCLRGDAIHYNNAGYRLLADIVYDRLISLGYFDSIQPYADKFIRWWKLPSMLENSLNKC